MEGTATDDVIVDVRAALTEVSLALGGTKVEGEGGRVVWDTDREPGIETVRDISKGGGEEDKGVGASGVDA